MGWKQTRGAARRLLTTTIAVVALTGSVLASPLAASAAPTTRIVAPSGAGELCTQAAPCALPTALKGSGPGDSVELLGGRYGEYTVSGPGGSDASPVTVRAAAGATASVVRITSSVPHTDWSGLTVTGTFYLNGPATGSTLTAMRFDGGGLFVRTAGATVSDSLFENGSSVDGIQVGRASDVLIEGNTIRDYNQSIDNGYHADCLQIFDSSRVTVRGNSIGNCYNAGIILSPGAGTGMTSILIESNFIQGCIVRSAACAGGSAVDLRPPLISDLVVRNNTIVDGSTRLLASPGLVFDRNIVGYLSDCQAPVTNTVVLNWNRAMCAQPTALGSGGSRSGTVAFVDQSGRDLHLVAPAQALVDGVTGTPAARDFDGDAIDRTVAGADSPGDGAEDPGEPGPGEPGGPGDPGGPGEPGGGGEQPPTGEPTVTLPARAGILYGVRSLDRYFAGHAVDAVRFVGTLGDRAVLTGTRGDRGWIVEGDLEGVEPGLHTLALTATTAEGEIETWDVVLRVVESSPGPGVNGR